MLRTWCRLVGVGLSLLLLVGCASSPEKRAAHEAKLQELEHGFSVELPLSGDDAFLATVQAFNNLNYGIKMASRERRKVQTGEKLLLLRLNRGALGNRTTATERTLRFYAHVDAGEGGAATVVLKPEVFINGVAANQLWGDYGAIKTQVEQVESELARVVEFGQLAPDLHREQTSEGSDTASL